MKGERGRKKRGGQSPEKKNQAFGKNIGTEITGPNHGVCDFFFVQVQYSCSLKNFGHHQLSRT